MTSEQFFTKNMKWIALALLFLLAIKSMQSCNRGTQLNMSKGTYIHQIDSLKKQYVDYREAAQDSIKKLNFQLQLANQQAKSSDEKASAVQSAVEKLKSNTTVVVRGAQVDTTKIKK